MINRILVLLIAGCALFGSVIVVELRSDDGGASNGAPVAIRPEPVAPPRAQGPRVDDLLATILGRPLFSPTRQPAARPDQPTGLDLGNVRLTGIVIEPERHLAIFAVPNAKLMVRSEGEMMNDWRVESITPGEVVLSGPAGTTTLEPKIDASIVRRVAAPPRPAQTPPQVAAPGPQPAAVAARPGVAPPVAGPPKPRSMPAVQSSGTPMSPLRQSGKQE
jgi:general secretion pathway protein N